MLNLLLEFAGIGAEQGVDVFRVLDKLDKIGIDKVRRELMDGYKDESGDTIRGVGLTADQVGRIERFLDIKSDSRGEVWRRCASCSPARSRRRADRRRREDLESPLRPRLQRRSRRRSTSRSRAASPTTPVPSSKRSCSTRRSSAPSSAAAVTTIWSCASSARRFRPSARRSASIASSPRSTHLGTRRQAEGDRAGAGRQHGPRPGRRLPADDVGAAPRRHPDRAVHRHREGPRQAAQYADQYDIPLAHPLRLEREGAGRRHDQGHGRSAARRRQAVGDRSEWLAARPGQITVAARRAGRGDSQTARGDRWHGTIDDDDTITPRRLLAHDRAARRASRATARVRRASIRRRTSASRAGGGSSSRESSKTIGARGRRARRRATEYGVTTGFGEFKDKPIAPDDLEQLQRNLLLSHSVGVGENSDPDDLSNYFSAEVVRGALATRLNAFLKGHSGVRRKLVEIVRRCSIAA